MFSTVPPPASLVSSGHASKLCPYMPCKFKNLNTLKLKKKSVALQPQIIMNATGCYTYQILQNNTLKETALQIGRPHLQSSVTLFQNNHHIK